MQDRWFGPAEMAQRLGVSQKALRVYERLGLVSPARTQAGWRAYGPAQQARLHQVLALRQLGLPLRRISALLQGQLASLDAVLTLQADVLLARQLQLERMLALLSAARASLAADGALSSDDLIKLTKETTMTGDKSSDWQAALEPLIEKHYTREEADELGRRKRQAYADAGYDEQSFVAAWEVLFAEARALKSLGDTESPRACTLVRRWQEMLSHFTAGDAAIAGKVRAVWTEAMADPAVAVRLPFQPAEFAFVEVIAAGMRARGEPC